MPLGDGWGWHPHQTAFHIHIRHVQSVWGIIMLSQGHMGAPLYDSTGQVVPRFWILGSLVEWKWSHFIIVEAHIHLRLLPTSILDIYKVFEPLVCYLRGIWMQHYIIIPATLAPYFEILGHLWSVNDTITWWLRLTSNSDIPHPYNTCTMCLRYWHAVSRAYRCTLESYRSIGQVDPRFWSFGSLVEWKWCNYIMVKTHIHLRLLSASILDTYKMFDLLVCCLTGIWDHYTGQFGLRFRIFCHLWSGNNAITSWLRLISTSDCFPYPY
jgi:hypothetical protein